MNNNPPWNYTQINQLQFGTLRWVSAHLLHPLRSMHAATSKASTREIHIQPHLLTLTSTTHFRCYALQNTSLVNCTWRARTFSPPQSCQPHNQDGCHTSSQVVVPVRLPSRSTDSIYRDFLHYLPGTTMCIGTDRITGGLVRTIISGICTTEYRVKMNCSR